MDGAVYALTKVFGIASISKAGVCNKDIDEICSFTVQYLSANLKSARTFKVEAKRSDKAFLLNSPQICEVVGDIY